MAQEKLRRNTRQRQVVLGELRKLITHPTAAELHELSRRRLPRISLARVYRNLELLTQMGVVRKLQISGGEARFDGNSDQHCHVRCVRCGRVDDAQGLPADPVRQEIKSLVPCQPSSDGWVAHGFSRGGHESAKYSCSPPLKRWATQPDLPRQIIVDRTLGGYEILGYRLEFVGICRECRTAPGADDGEPLPG